MLISYIDFNVLVIPISSISMLLTIISVVCHLVETIEDYRKEATKRFEPSFEKYVAGGAGSQPDDNARAFNK